MRVFAFGDELLKLEAPLTPGTKPEDAAAELLAGAGLEVDAPIQLLGTDTIGDSLHLVYGYATAKQRAEIWDMPVDEDENSAYNEWRRAVWDDHMLRKYGLTVDVFVVRDAKILVLLRRRTGAGIWYIPGGLVDAGEDPAAAVARETKEETGLDIEEVELLRVWSYRLSSGRDAFHATYSALSPAGDVVISEEHDAYRWMDAPRYIGEYLPSVPDLNPDFIREVTKNVELLIPKIQPRVVKPRN